MGEDFDLFIKIEDIAKEIQTQKDNVMAMEFTKSIMELLRQNGVVPKLTEYTHENVKENSIEQLYGVSIDELDFSEHDKKFKERIGFLTRKNEKLFDENASLKQRIAELESRETVELPFDPLECANYLINATYERETNGIERTFHNLPDKVNSDRYTVDDLEQIAEHLLVYCKHNKKSE